MSKPVTTRRLRFLPYRFDDHALASRIERCALDGREVSGAYDPERHLLDLSSYRWTTARLTVAVTVEGGLPAEVFPTAEYAAPPGRLVMSVTCPATRLRRSVVLADGRVEPGVCRGELDLALRDVQGAVELTPVLVRAVNREDADDGLATLAHQRLASGRALEVRIDAARAPGGEYLDTRYESFRDKGPPQFPHPDAMYQLDCDGDAPILWLNLDHTRICSVLEGAGSVGRVARLRDVVFAHLGHTVWTRLFWRAARSVQQAGETVHDWEDAVLARLLPRVYPDAPDHESRLEALRADLDGYADDLVLARLDGALQDLLETARRVSSLAEESA